jgi:hypothetical protein
MGGQVEREFVEPRPGSSAASKAPASHVAGRQQPDQQRASCPDPEIEVALERDAWWGCCAELNSTKVSSGGVTTLRWRMLPEDDYRLVFKKKRSPANAVAGCVCLVGDVVIAKFHAPRPTGGPIEA